MPRARTLLLLTLAVAMVAGLATHATPADPIKIAYIDPLSGPFAATVRQTSPCLLAAPQRALSLSPISLTLAQVQPCVARHQNRNWPRTEAPRTGVILSISFL